MPSLRLSGQPRKSGGRLNTSWRYFNRYDFGLCGCQKHLASSFIECLKVYQDIVDHLEMQISKLERKRMQWKVDIREGLVKAKLKAGSYYGKTESPRGLLFGLGTCLNPYYKLNLF